LKKLKAMKQKITLIAVAVVACFTGMLISSLSYANEESLSASLSNVALAASPDTNDIGVVITADSAKTLFSAIYTNAYNSVNNTGISMGTGNPVIWKIDHNAIAYFQQTNQDIMCTLGYEDGELKIIMAPMCWDAGGEPHLNQQALIYDQWPKEGIYSDYGNAGGPNSIKISELFSEICN
jgi:hypothetical protein